MIQNEKRSEIVNGVINKQSLYCWQKYFLQKTCNRATNRLQQCVPTSWHDVTYPVFVCRDLQTSSSSPFYARAAALSLSLVLVEKRQITIGLLITRTGSWSRDGCAVRLLFVDEDREETVRTRTLPTTAAVNSGRNREKWILRKLKLGVHLFFA